MARRVAIAGTLAVLVMFAAVVFLASAACRSFGRTRRRDTGDRRAAPPSRRRRAARSRRGCSTSPKTGCG